MDVSKEGRAKRIDCKIMQLPPGTRQRVDDMIINREKTYLGISEWLKEQGYEISKSAVGTYAYGLKQMAQQVAADLAKTKAILEYVDKHPDVDATKAANVVMVSGLLQRASTAEDEYQEIPLETCGRLIASFSKISLAEKKLTFEMRKKIDLAFDEMEGQLLAAINHDPVLSEQFHKVLLAAKEKMTDNEQENS